MSSDPPSAAPSPASGSSAEANEGGSLAERVSKHAEPLLEALAERVPGSREHAEGTGSWALAIAVELGLGRDRCLAIREGARLHDIGLVYADAELVAAPEGELDAEALRRRDSYAATGARLAQGAGLPAEVCGWLRLSRESYDGSGVPEGLIGGAIPLESRIIRAACAFELKLAAASSSGESGDGPSARALSELKEMSGSQLDRGAVEALAALVERTVG